MVVVAAPGGGGGTSQGATGNQFGFNGGGVGIYGQGNNGAGGTSSARSGGAGSINIGDGNAYGGSAVVGGTGLYSSNGSPGQGGAVRIVWPGSTRQYPSTNVSTDI